MAATSSNTCPDYVSFTADREERPDRYYATHGVGWLWYEPPLEGDTADSILTLKGVYLENPAERADKSFLMGNYKIRMDFRRRQAWVSRLTAENLRDAQAKNGIKIPTAPDPMCPVVYFTMTLDSGATLPTLPASDLAKLGIQRDRYAAQTVFNRVETTTGIERGDIYELDVGVYGLDDSTLTTASPPLWPTEPAVLGATIPVLVFQRQGGAASRLSGMLPFHVCYMSSAPGAFRMWLGEDRREVLGSGRLPAGMRWSGWLTMQNNYRPLGILPCGNPSWTLDLGTPRCVTFEHDTPSGERSVWEEQVASGRSEIWRAPRHMNQSHATKSDVNVDHWVIEPQVQRDETEAAVKAEEKEAERTAQKKA